MPSPLRCYINASVSGWAGIILQGWYLFVYVQTNPNHKPSIIKFKEIFVIVRHIEVF